MKSLTPKDKVDRYLKRGAYALTREEFLSRTTCPSCNGDGFSNYPNTCGHCHGEGVVQEKQVKAVTPISLHYSMTNTKGGMVAGTKVWTFSDGKSYIAEDYSKDDTYVIRKIKEINLADHPELSLVLKLTN